jgi:hypothetical protein
MAGVGLNGADPRPLRLVVFGESIVSDWGNPAATSWRALLRALTAAGHDAVFLERRKNDAVVDLLRARGGDAMRAFGRAYPDVRNRTYDLPIGAERSVWFGREVSTADAAIVLDDAPEGIFTEIVAYDTPRLVKVLARTERSPVVPVKADRFDLVLGEGTLPSVEVSAGQPAAERSGVLLVAYDDEAVANRVAARLAPLHPELITPGRLPEPWRYVPEVQMPAPYQAAKVTVVVGGPREVGIDVRALLPAASGSPTIAVNPSGVQADWPDGLIRPATEDSVQALASEYVDRDQPPPAFPPEFNATRIAAGLVERLRRIRTERMGLIQTA